MELHVKMGKVPQLASLALLVLFALCCSSCSTSVALAVANDSSGDVSLQTKLSPSVLSAIAGFTGADSTETLFDKQQIVESLTGAGFAVKDVRFPSNVALTVNAKNGNLTKVLPGSKDFIVIKKDKNISDMTIKLSPENIRKAVALMPEDTVLYIDLLIAPIFTGEAMSSEDYADLIGIAYGENVAADLRKSVATLAFTVPGTIVSAEFTNDDKNTVAVKDKTIQLSMPLLELLTNLNGNTCRIRWLDE